ncbi:MAG: hypothetical protein QOK28_1399 [Actinomycetota bacterium]|jgi:hypothetical protein
MDWLTVVSATVEFQEHPELGPTQVDACDETTVRCVHAVLPGWLGQPVRANELYCVGLEQRLGWGRAAWPAVKDAADQRRAFRSPGSEQWNRRFDRGDRRQLFPQRRFEGVLPARLVEFGCEVEECLEPIGDANAVDLDDGADEPSPPRPVAFVARPWIDGEPRLLDARQVEIEPAPYGGSSKAPDSAAGHDRPGHRSVEHLAGSPPSAYTPRPRSMQAPERTFQRSCSSVMPSANACAVVKMRRTRIPRVWSTRGGVMCASNGRDHTANGARKT